MEFTTAEFDSFLNMCEMWGECEEFSITIGVVVYANHTDIEARMHAKLEGQNVKGLKDWTIPTGSTQRVSKILKDSLAEVGYGLLGKVLGKMGPEVSKYSFNIAKLEGGEE